MVEELFLISANLIKFYSIYFLFQVSPLLSIYQHQKKFLKKKLLNFNNWVIRLITDSIKWHLHMRSFRTNGRSLQWQQFRKGCKNRIEIVSQSDLKLVSKEALG
jgi:hypothetical protein